MKDPDFYKKRARWWIAGFVLAVAVLGGGFWYLAHRRALPSVSQLESSAQYLATKASEVGQENVSMPSPLVQKANPGATTQSGSRAKSSGVSTSGGASEYVLTREGVIADTNAQRAANGNLPPLAENATLDDIATIRLQDMFAKQYFAHVSPTGASALTVASSVGYAHIALGENLALGNFEGDQGVVTAWMNSPGHRANILDTHYTQIGVAVGEGVYDGAIDWIAVQVFGRPASDCPLPDPALQAEIQAGQAQASSTAAQLQTMQAQINNAQPQSGAAYDQMAENYNTLLGQYNALVASLKTEIAQYNAAAEAYNQCIEE